MKTLNWSVPALAVALWLNPASADVTTSYTVNQAIPDGSISGVASTEQVSAPFNGIAHIDVSLDIAGTGFGAFNGDIYATLEHNGIFTVLLNGTGRTATDPFGYGDNGFNIVLSDQNNLPDVHNYRVTLFGSPAIGIAGGTGALTGTWAADGRNVDPDLVTDTSARTALLSNFDISTDDPNGSWTLFVADTQPGGTAELVSWGLDVSAPDGGSTGLMAGFGFAACALARCFQQRRQQAGA